MSKKERQETVGQDGNRNTDICRGARSGVFRSNSVFLGWRALLDTLAIGQVLMQSMCPKPSIRTHRFF